MADFTKGRHAFVGGVEIGAMFSHGDEVAFAFGKGTQIFPNAPVAIYGCCEARVVEDAGAKWFEFGFRVDSELVGNPAAGWHDAGNYLRIEQQWSSDLLVWQMGKFIPAPVPVIALDHGGKEYWSRALNLQDSAVKTGQLSVSQTNGDPRSNGFNYLRVAGAPLPLDFPYDLSVPGTAARLQADISAYYPGTVVTGTSGATWSISIPNVDFSAFSDPGFLGWPTYLAGSDPFGNPAYSSGSGLKGDFVDGNGLVIHPSAFGRLKISAGTRYDPWL
jgi:hypothetical protein